MSTYSKTNIQLFNQLRNQMYSFDDIIYIRKAYDLAMQLFTGMYRPSGATFISHGVGTAGILAALNLSKEMIVSGLLHAAYEHGDFGIIGMDTIPDRKRKLLKSHFGEEVEEYIARYTQLKWNSKTIEMIRSKFEFLDTTDRNVLLIRIANELEDNLDMGALYCPDAERRKAYINRWGSVITYMATELGFPQLTVSLKQTFSETLSAKIPAELLNYSSNVRAYRISPLSYKKRLIIKFGNQIFIGRRHFKKWFRSEKSKASGLFLI